MQKKSKFPHKNSKFFICIFKEKVPTSLHDLVMNMEFSQNSIFALQNDLFQKFLPKMPTYPHTYPQKQVFVWITRGVSHRISLLCICVEICRFSSTFGFGFTCLSS